MLGLMAIGIGLISLLLGATVFGLPLFKDYFSSPVIITLNLLPPVILVFLLYFASGRAWIAFTIPTLTVLTLSTVQFYKVQIHGDPFIFSDFAVMREATAAFFDMSITINWKVLLAAAALAFGILFSVFFLKHKLKGHKFRIIATAAAVAVSAGLYTFIYTDTDLYSDTSVRIDGSLYSAARRSVSKGFVYPFIHSIYQATSVRLGIPDWYDSREAQRLSSQYEAIPIPDDKKVNIIAIMLESFVDLSTFNVLDFNVDIYAPLHRLQAESVSGTVVTNVFAGWTIDTERLFLTGNTQFISYTKPTNSYVHYLKGQGYHTEGLHTGDGWFYDRRAVNSYMGFDRYLFLEDFEDGSRDDAFFFAAVKNQYENRDRNIPYFSYNLSFQNHLGYDSLWMLDTYAIEQGGLTDESFLILANFLAGIHDTALRLERFIDDLRDDQDPLIVLVFGDHMPWLGDGGSVYSELGINIERETNDGFLNRFSTPYLIWANDAAKTIVENDFTGDGGSFSTSFLMGELFKLCSWGGDGQMQALREFKETVDIINAPYGMPFRMFRENGELTNELSLPAAEKYRELLQMEILRRENFKY